MTQTQQKVKPTGVSIVLAGEAGQGIQSIETLLVNVLRKDGFHVFATKEYMSRVRGGVNSTQIRSASGPVRSYCDSIDIFIPLDNESYRHHEQRLSGHSAVIADSAKVSAQGIIDVPFKKIATEFGNPLFANTVAAGVICGILEVAQTTLNEFIAAVFQKKGQAIVDSNIAAAEKGYAIGVELRDKEIIAMEGVVKEQRVDSLLLSGSQSVALGAVAGGCDSCFAYPMTPGTGVFTLMAGYADKCGIAVEQVEDEIGVINMALGAWYAGGRALVSTSGGGFALMTEGLSLAGMIESPVVIHLAQRPGPATGLPTRTEQGDLNLVLYAGHGLFPRIVLSPGDTKQAFELTQLAFELADKYQIPVFILTDQYFVDSYYDIPPFTLKNSGYTRHIQETTRGYKRYALSQNGISPRGVPGFGSGMVCADSDEHDESGRITEDLDGISLAMKDKRFKKFDTVKQAAIAPQIIGPKNYSTLIVGWGSVYNTIAEALELSGDTSTSFLFFPQVYPVHSSARELLKSAREVIVVENNQSGQFARLLEQETGIAIEKRVLKYNGLPFSVEEVANAISSKRAASASEEVLHG